MNTNSRSERRRWAACFSILGALVMSGAVLVSRPPAAEAQAAEGVAQFNRACGRCHPHGEEDTGPSILNKNLSADKMQKVIRQGTKRMKAIPATKLSDADLAHVMVYLRSIHAVQ